MEQTLYWLVGMVGVPLIQSLKNKFGLEGNSALWLTVGVSTILAVAALFVSKELNVDDFTPEGLFAAFGQVMASATLAYKLLVSKE